MSKVLPNHRRAIKKIYQKSWDRDNMASWTTFFLHHNSLKKLQNNTIKQWGFVCFHFLRSKTVQSVATVAALTLLNVNAKTRRDNICFRKQIRAFRVWFLSLRSWFFAFGKMSRPGSSSVFHHQRALQVRQNGRYGATDDVFLHHISLKNSQKSATKQWRVAGLCHPTLPTTRGR